MKKIISLILMMFIVISAVPTATAADTSQVYELWARAPEMSMYTAEQVHLFNAYRNNCVVMYELPELGENYYLAMIEEKNTDGGYNGTSNTTDWEYYVIVATEKCFEVISTLKARNEYRWNGGHAFRDISSQIDEGYYQSIGSDVPKYIFNPQNKYVNSNITEYIEYFIITASGKLYTICENSEYGYESTPHTHGGKLYAGKYKYESNGRTYTYKTADGVTACSASELRFKSGAITREAAILVPTADMTVSNGYYKMDEGFSSNHFAFNLYKLTDDIYMTYNQCYVNLSESINSNYINTIKMYKMTGNHLELYDKKVFATTSTAGSSYTVTKISGLDKNAYNSSGYKMPIALVGKYLIFEDGSVSTFTLDGSKFTEYNFCAYNGILAVNRTKEGSSTINYIDPATKTYSFWQRINQIYTKADGSINLSKDIDMKLGVQNGLDGYYDASSSFVASEKVCTIGITPLKSWFGRCPTNVFPDGRYVEGDWQKSGTNSFEVWYYVYSPDGKLIGLGPTGEGAAEKSVMNLPSLTAFTYNNSKFVLSSDDLSISWTKEFYRYSVLEQDDEGEIDASGGEIGEKTITEPSEETDTVVVQSVIDFGEDELPLGYNIRDNVIDSDKLDITLRDNVNAIRLNNVVIVADSGSDSGVQNTGTTLASYSTYDYSMGSSYIRIYSNGQNLNWYCYNAKSLTPGTYNKTYYVGDKVIYITFKIVSPPSTDTSTTVVF